MPRQTYVIGAITALATAAMLRYGEYDPLALALLIVGCGLLLLTMAKGAPGRAPPAVWLAALMAMAASTAFGIGKLPGVSWALCAGLVVAAAATAVLTPRPAAWFCLGAAVAIEVAMLGIGWVWGSSPIDVFGMLQAGSHQLLVHGNPYAILAPVTPYTGYHGPAELPFDYGPAAAIIDVPGRILGDVRLMHAALALVLCGCVVALVRRAAPDDRLRMVALAALLPLTLPMVYFAWVDLPAMALFALWLVLRPKHAWWAALALGVSLAAKPSVAPALVVMVVWLPRARRDIAAALGVAALVILPFVVVTGPAAFFTDVVSNLADQPPRLDSLTIDAFLHASSLPLLPGVVSVIAVAAVTVLAIAVRRPTGVADCLVGGAVIATATFLFAKVAYLNYYYTAAVFLVLALAMVSAPLEEPISAGWLERWLPHGLRAAYSESPG